MDSDDEFARQLGARLHAEVADVRCAPGLSTALRRRHARRTLAVRAAVATPVTAAVAVAAVALHAGAGGGRGGQASGTATASATHLLDAAYVSERTTGALARISDYVLHSRGGIGGYKDDDWLDPVSGRSRLDSRGPDGGRLYSIGTSASMSERATVTVVDFPDRAWWTYVSEPPPNPPSGNAVKVSAFTDPAEIQAALRDGTAELLGEEMLAGHDVLHLRVTYPPRIPGIKEPTRTLDLWVDSTSFLPYRATNNGGGKAPYTVDYQWLPRTQANLAQLHVTPPAGFTRHAHPIEPKATGSPRG